MRERDLRPWAYAAALGVAAALLNQLHLPLLTEETPRFLLGGSLVLLAFASLGQRAGLLAGALSIAPVVFPRGPVAWPTPAEWVVLLYLLEAWFAHRVYRRTCSFILGVAAFWFGLGWWLDFALYGRWVGLSRAYVALLLVKQLFNALMNAAVVEALLRFPAAERLLRLPGHRTEPVPLRTYAFQRVILAVVFPSLLLGLAYTRSEFWNEIAAAQERSNRTAENISAGIREYLGAVRGALERTARQIGEPDRRAVDGLAALLARLRRERPELAKTAVFDAGGTVLAADPPVDVAGRPLVGLSLAGQEYFRQLRQSGTTVYTPLFDPSTRVRGAEGLEHVLLVVEPLVDRQGRFAGGVVVALDPGGLLPVLADRRSAEAERATLFDRDGRVILSLDPARPIGSSLPEAMYDHQGEPLGARAWRLLQESPVDFAYDPPPDGSVAGRLHINPYYGTVRRVVVSDWRVLVDLPAAELQEMIVPTAYEAVALVLLTIAVLYGAVAVLTGRIAEPMAGVSGVAGQIASGRVGADTVLQDLQASPVTEFRSLARDLKAMQEAIAAHRAQSAAREQASQELFVATFEQAAVGIAHIDREGRILRINDAFCRLLGRARDELLQARVHELGIAEDRWFETIAGQVVEGERTAGSLERRLRDGVDPKWARLTLSVVRTPDGQPRFYMLVAEDVTDRKALEEQFLQSQKLESVGRLAGGVAHDFNNLLTPILAYSEMALAETVDEPSLREPLEQVHLAAQRAKELTWKLLAFSRKQVLEFKTVHLGEVIREFESMIRLALRENIELQIDVADDLGCVLADPTQIQQILMNLAVNAQDAMPEGGRLRVRAANVEVSSEFALRHAGVPEGAAVVLSVSDTGTGIAPEIALNIFEPFFTTKQRGRGTGLGLATVYGIARQHGAGVVVASRPGAGATFSVYFPRAEEVPAAAPARLADSVDATAGPFGRRRGDKDGEARATVLVVEDDEAVRRVVVRSLVRGGYRVLEAGDAEEALRIAESNLELDIVLTDVILPGMSGRELARRLGRPDLPTLYMSGYTRELLSQDGMLPPGTHLLSKPFSARALLDKLREVLGAAPAAPS